MEQQQKSQSQNSSVQQQLNNRQFALNLYQQIKQQKPNENIFFSPFNISACLAMVYAGASEETKTEFENSLKFLNDNNFHDIFSQHQQILNTTKNVELNLANKIWPMADKPLLPEYVDLLQKKYQSQIQELNFANKEESAQIINNWVEQQTKNKIKNIVSPDSLNEYTRLVLTSAIYFKGNWANKFKKEQTQKAPFKTSTGETVQTDMMYQQEKLPFYQQSKFKMLQLPYIGQTVSMIAVLPQNGASLDEVEKLLTVENLGKFEQRLYPNNEIRVQFPKFKFELQFSASDLLKNLGLNKAFTQDANFSGINGKDKDLFISDVVHKAFVEVNEEGTEAAAATAVMMMTNCLPQIDTFIVDQPFVFYIKDQQTGNILFYGRYNKPE